MDPKESRFSIKSFVKGASFGGMLLIFVTIIGLVWANSKFYDSYHHLWHNVEFGLSLGSWELKSSLHHWINDGLMALFFFTIGLEIKREVLAGELSSVKKATMPIVAAIGGMLVPALIYAAINFNNPQNIDGWGIPMATDIAFALGIMS
ncbi:MAG: Na+/H+ antiporter NhaA, partial [Bacteroidales bacterium]|nr:Na+/H+ antiporter NhaA [Bacteroidales bacterium]